MIPRLHRHRIEISNESGVSLSEAPIRDALLRLLERYEQPPCELSVLLCDDATIADLNSRFRGVDGATDVLSFPAGMAPLLGDIAISVDTAQVQATARGTTLADEMVCLAVHGGLHLLGFDDDTDEARDDMIRRMNEICSVQDWHSLPH